MGLFQNSHEPASSSTFFQSLESLLPWQQMKMITCFQASRIGSFQWVLLNSCHKLSICCRILGVTREQSCSHWESGVVSCSCCASRSLVEYLNLQLTIWTAPVNCSVCCWIVSFHSCSVLPYNCFIIEIKQNGTKGMECRSVKSFHLNGMG